jgi:hypothetical protein
MSMVSTDKFINKLAPVVGLLAQPFWLIQGYNASQFGALVVSSVFCLIYLTAIWKNYLK